MLNSLEDVKKILAERGYEDTVVFDNPSYYSAFIGVDIHTTNAIYDYEKMIEFLVDTENMEYEDAIDFISYNTLRALPYQGDRAPIILDTAGWTD